MTEMILKQLAVSEEYLEAAKIAALLHDVGALQGNVYMKPIMVCPPSFFIFHLTNCIINLSNFSILMNAFKQLHLFSP
jgi:hypothetical protein